jgi:hypothetical protein
MRETVNQWLCWDTVGFIMSLRLIGLIDGQNTIADISQREAKVVRGISTVERVGKFIDSERDGLLADQDGGLSASLWKAPAPSFVPPKSISRKPHSPGLPPGGHGG